MKYRAVVIDLDGTAVDSPQQKLPSQRLIDASKKLLDSEVEIFAATGRAESFARPLLETLPTSEYAIIAGGTRILDKKIGEDAWACLISQEKIREILAILKDKKYGFLWNDSTEDDYLGGGWPLSDFDLNTPTYFFEVCFVPDNKAPELVRELEQIDSLTAVMVVAQRPGTRDIHIIDQYATKEHAIAKLSKLTKIPTTQMIGIGDGHNDLHLFNAVKYKVAMGNAVDDLKAAADLVIGDVKEDGLAEFFEKLAAAKGEIK